jgi:hypothetical protein
MRLISVLFPVYYEGCCVVVGFQVRGISVRMYFEVSCKVGSDVKLQIFSADTSGEIYSRSGHLTSCGGLVKQCMDIGEKPLMRVWTF